MTPTDRYSLAPLNGEEERSALLRDGRAVARVHGTVLESQFAEKEASIVLASAGVPYEEAIFVSLLVEDRVLDAYEIGAPYTPGVLRDANGLNGTVTFVFAGARFTVRRLSSGRMAWLGQPRAVKRLQPFWKPAYLSIERNGTGETP